MKFKQKSYQTDDNTEAVLEELRDGFGVSSNSAVIRRALALARIMMKNADDDHVVRIIDKDEKEKNILLAG